MASVWGPNMEPQCLDPCEVSCPSARPEANEAGIDLEVGGQDKAEMFAFPSMKVEYYSITANEPRIIAPRSYTIATGLSTCSEIKLSIQYGSFEVEGKVK